MNISVIAFVVMAVVTVLFFAATVVLEWNSRFLAKTQKPKSQTADDPDHLAALFESPILESPSARDHRPESSISSL